jgi:hypothetical protein
MFVILLLMLGLLSACGMDEGEYVSDEETQAQATEVVEAPVEEEAQPEVEEQPTEELAQALPTVSQPAVEGDSTWLVMIYSDADDEVLEKDLFIDLNEAEMVGSTDRVTVVAQMDRMDGGYDGDGDWTSAKRFLITQDLSGDMETLASEELEDLGEVDMGSKDTLIDFASWAIQNYPATHYALILSDHGAGWTGGWTDNAPNEGSQLFLSDIDAALAGIVENTGVGQLEFVGFDACLMSQIDVLSAIAPYARFAVGSEETEPSLGWAYSSFLTALNENPDMDGGELGKTIVDSYIAQDGRITDPAALEILASDLRAPGVSGEAIAQELGGDVTLTAVELSKLEDLNTAFNELIMTLQDVDQSAVAEARAYTQAYTSIFGDEMPAPYIDLGHFTSLLAEMFPDSPVSDSAAGVSAAIQAMTVAEKHGPNRPGSTGITLYFPDGDLYAITANPDLVLHYPRISGRFSAASLWDDFLAYHYASNPIDPTAVDASAIAPQSTTSDFTKAIDASALLKGKEIVKPGAGVVDFKALTASSESISVNDMLTLSVDLTGKNVGYMYIYTAYYDPGSDSYLTTDLDFVGTDKAKQVGGVSYPDWGEGEDMSMDVDWEPVLWTVSDGQHDAIAAAEAETYGATAETTFYRVWGQYRIAGSQQTHDAFLRFDANGALDSVTIFSGPEQNAAPRKIIPAPGDQFTVEEEWLEFDQNPEGEYVYYDGDTVTFGADGFTMVSNEAAAGDYVIGIVVEDLDGNTFEKYLEIAVTQ